MANSTLKTRVLAPLTLALAAGMAVANVVTLPDLGGNAIAFDVNDSGVIVGGATEPETFICFPVVWSNDSIQTLPTDSFRGGFALAINATGTTVGVLLPQFGHIPTAAVWTPGSSAATVLPDLGFGGSALDINMNGTIVGNVNQENQSLRAAVWENGALTVLPLPDGLAEGTSVASGIDAAGRVYGTVLNSSTGQVFAVRWTSGNPEFLTSAAVQEIIPGGVSSDGRFAIRGYDASGNLLLNTILQPTGEEQILGRLEGDFGSRVVDLNTRGEAVGYVRLPNENPFATIQAAIWVNGVQSPLPTVTPSVSGWAEGINDSGTVVGYEWDISTGDHSALKWSIVSNPPSDPGVPTVEMPSMRAFPGDSMRLVATVRQGGRTVANRNVLFQVAGKNVGTAVSNAQGQASVNYTVPVNQPVGSLELMASLGGSRYVRTALKVEAFPTAVSATNVRGRVGAPVILQAQLRNSARNRSLAGQTVVFTMGERTVNAQTDRRGIATARFSVPAQTQRGSTMSYEVRYAGNAQHLAADSTGTVRL